MKQSGNNINGIEVLGNGGVVRQYQRKTTSFRMSLSLVSPKGVCGRCPFGHSPPVYAGSFSLLDSLTTERSRRPFPFTFAPFRVRLPPTICNTNEKRHPSGCRYRWYRLREFAADALSGIVRQSTQARSACLTRSLRNGPNDRSPSRSRPFGFDSLQLYAIPTKNDILPDVVIVGIA